MRLERQVQRWREAGIIDATTAERIIAHERRASRPVLLLAIGGRGAFAIGVGLISVIAANWGDIPRLVKLLAMLGLFGANAYGLLGPRPPTPLGHRRPCPGLFCADPREHRTGWTNLPTGRRAVSSLAAVASGITGALACRRCVCCLRVSRALAVTGAFLFDPLVDLLGHDLHATILVCASLGVCGSIRSAACG